VRTSYHVELTFNSLTTPVALYLLCYVLNLTSLGRIKNDLIMSIILSSAKIREISRDQNPDGKYDIKSSLVMV
jgi:hypothetical protein